MSTASPSASHPSHYPPELRAVDRDLMLALRRGVSLGIGELTETLGVTATAVRQRIERLLAMGLIDREKVVAGRGRPTYCYRLTVSGHRHAGADPAELADAMWVEILALPDSAVRTRLLAAIAARLGHQFAIQIGASLDEAHGGDDSTSTVAERMECLSEMLIARRVDTGVSLTDDLPVLDVCGCPFPSFTEAAEADRAMCRLEEKMFSEALGQPVSLSRCRLDGDDHCQFTPVRQDDNLSK